MAIGARCARPHEPGDRRGLRSPSPCSTRCRGCSAVAGSGTAARPPASRSRGARVLGAAARRPGLRADARDRRRLAGRGGQVADAKASSTCTRCCRWRSPSSPSSCASPPRRRCSTSAASRTPRRSGRLPEAEQQARRRGDRQARDGRDGAVGARRRGTGAARRRHGPRVLAREAAYIFPAHACSPSTHRWSCSPAPSRLVAACGSQACRSPRRSHYYHGRGAVPRTLLRLPHAQRRRRQWARPRASPTALKTNGPNFNIRKENDEQVLYAIRNGGFSGAIMPENIVVGEDAQAIAAFLAKYSGHQAQNVPSTNITLSTK